MRMSNSLFKETAGAEEDTQTVARQQDTAIHAKDGRVEKMGLEQDIVPHMCSNRGCWGQVSRMEFGSPVQSGKHEPVLRIHF